MQPFEYGHQILLLVCDPVWGWEQTQSVEPQHLLLPIVVIIIIIIIVIIWDVSIVIMLFAPVVKRDHLSDLSLPIPEPSLHGMNDEIKLCMTS